MNQQLDSLQEFEIELFDEIVEFNEESVREGEFVNNSFQLSRDILRKGDLSNDIPEGNQKLINSGRSRKININIPVNVFAVPVVHFKTP